MKRTVLVLSGLVVLSLAIYAWPVRPFLFGMRQVRTIADGRSLSLYLEKYRDANGRYPSRLQLAVPSPKHLDIDGWGHRWVYVTDGSAFLLLSLGRDGRPDRPDYLLMRGAAPPLFHRTCNDWDADQIITNRGIHQGCGK